MCHEKKSGGNWTKNINVMKWIEPEKSEYLTTWP